MVANRLSLVLVGAKSNGSGQLAEAWSDLERKLADGLPRLFCGPIRFLLVIAVAGSELQLGMLQPPGLVSTFARNNTGMHSDQP